jgi:FkbM family methyltransferase
MEKGWTFWVESIAGTVKDYLPESRFKDLLRSIYRRYHNSLYALNLYALNRIITKVELLEGDVLFVELDNGTKFYGPRDKVVFPAIKYGNSRKLEKIKSFEHFGSFFGALHDQYMMGINEEYFKLRQGDVVVDMGAHVGTFSIRAAQIVGADGLVIAIEPEPNNLNLLQRNIEVNGLQNVIIVGKGVWSKRGNLRFYLSEQTWQHSCLSQVTGSNEYTEIEVDTLDNILREIGVKKVNFIKMDVEGAEIEALKGMDEVC